jgi:hypothetical protein
MLDEDRLLALDHHLHEMRQISIRRHLLEERTQRRLIRVRARDFPPGGLPFLVDHVDGRPVREILNRQPRHVCQRLLVFERGRQRDTDLRQELLFLFNPSPLVTSSEIPSRYSGRPAASRMGTFFVCRMRTPR